MNGLDPQSGNLFNEKLKTIVNESKYIAIKAAELIPDIREKQAEKRLIHNNDISIKPFYDGIEVSWKGKLPSKEYKRGYPFYGYGFEESLREVIGSFCVEHGIKPFKPYSRASVKITSVCASLSKRLDYDNTDLHEILNALKDYILTDDSPENFVLCQDFEFGDEDIVKIQVKGKTWKTEETSDISNQD